MSQESGVPEGEEVSLALPVRFEQSFRLSEVKAVHAWNTMMSPVVQ